MKILSIDAWAGNEPFVWEWNNWFTAGYFMLHEWKIDYYMLRRQMG